jgi:hypothetical protein
MTFHELRYVWLIEKIGSDIWEIVTFDLQLKHPTKRLENVSLPETVNFSPRVRNSRAFDRSRSFESDYSAMG